MTKQIPPVNRENADYTRREVLRLAWIMFGVIVIGAVVAAIITTLNDKWAVTIRQGLIFIWAGYAPVALLAVVLARRGLSTWAVRLLIGGLMLVLLLTELRVTGFGLVLGASLIIFTASIVAQVRLASGNSARLILASALIGLLILALDLYAPGTRETVSTEVSVLVNVLIALMVGLVGILALRHWPQFRLRTKLIVGFIFVTLVSVFAVSVISTVVVAGNLTNQVGMNLRALSTNKAELIASAVDREVDLAVQLASSDLLRSAAVSMNSVYPNDPAALDAQVRELNRQWKRSSVSDPPVQLVLSSPSSVQLLRFRDSFRENLQILMTDQYGDLVAATNPPDSFYQGDQEWWIKAYNGGTGANYVSQPVYVPELDRVGIVFAVPIHDPTTAKVVGVIQAVHSLEGLKNQLGLSPLGATGTTELIFPSGQVLHPTGVFEFLSEPDTRAVATLSGAPFANVVYGGVSVLASQMPVKSNDPNSRARDAVSGWKVIASQSPTEALLPVTQSGQAALLTGVGVLLLAGLLALVAAQFFSSSITRLTTVAEKVTEGDLTARATVDSEDEVGTLAMTFNRMTGRLRQSLETLEQRVADRTADLARAGEELEHRANNLETNAEIARAAASTLKLEELLPLVTRSIGERFGFAHVGIYMLDAPRENAVLQAAYSGLGQARLEPGEKVPVEPNTFVGMVITKGERRLAQDVSWDSLYPQSPRLGGTRSELALPLVEGGQTIGVLDVHRAQVGGFTPPDVTALATLADQISIAIQNARSFERQVALTEENRRAVEVQTQLAEENKRSAERAAKLADENRLAAERQAVLAEENKRSAERAEALAEENRLAAERQAALATENQRLLERSQQAVTELNSLTRRLTGEGWELYLDTVENEVIVQDAVPELSDAQPLLDPLDRARSAGQVVTTTNGHSTVALPIILRGEVIGSMALEDSDPDRKWNDDEIALAEQVSERLALALDNARLYSQSQHELAERKRAEEQIRRQNAYLNALADTTVGLIQRLESQALVDTILHRASALVGTQNGYVYLLDRQTQEMQMRLGTGTYARLIGQTTGRGRGLAGTVWETGEPLVLEDYQQWPQRLQAAGRSEIRAVLGVPLKSGAQVIGVLGLAHTEAGRVFDATEVEALQRLAQLASIALDNAQLYTEAQQELSERKRTEQALAESEAFYHNLVELLPENLCMKDLEGRFVFVNQRYCQDAGLPREEIIGKTDYDMHPKELADKYRADDLQIIRTGDVIDTIEAHQTLHGDRTFVHTVKSPTRDAGGQITGAQILFWDVTEQMRAQEAMRQQNEYFVAMHDMSLAMIGRHDVNELLTDIVAHAGTLVGTEHGYVYLLNPATDQIEMRVGVGIYHEFVGSSARRGQGLAGTAWQSGEPVAIEDYRNWPGRLPHPSRDQLRAVVGVPLKSGEETIGVMGLAYLEEGRRFGPNEIDILGRFAQLAAIALDNAQLFQDSQRRLNELGALNRISQALATQLDFDTLTHTIGEQVREVFDVQNAYVAIYDRARNQIDFPYFMDEGRMVTADPLPYGQGLTSRIIQTCEPLLLNRGEANNPQNAPRVIGASAHAFLGVPIMLGSEAIGALSIQGMRPTDTFTDDDLRLLSTIAAGVGVALQNARLFKEAQERAQREFLTREIVARVSRSIHQDTILQTTARQLGHALGSSHVVIRLKGTTPGEGNGDSEPRP